MRGSNGLDCSYENNCPSVFWYYLRSRLQIWICFAKEPNPDNPKSRIRIRIIQRVWSESGLSKWSDPKSGYSLNSRIRVTGTWLQDYDPIYTLLLWNVLWNLIKSEPDPGFILGLLSCLFWYNMNTRINVLLSKLSAQRGRIRVLSPANPSAGQLQRAPTCCSTYPGTCQFSLKFSIFWLQKGVRWTYLQIFKFLGLK